jgi:hypothetical protein
MTGSVFYIGSWNAATNTPAISSGTSRYSSILTMYFFPN